jgi:hypothetical protein
LLKVLTERNLEFDALGVLIEFTYLPEFTDAVPAKGKPRSIYETCARVMSPVMQPQCRDIAVDGPSA